MQDDTANVGGGESACACVHEIKSHCKLLRSISATVCFPSQNQFSHFELGRPPRADALPPEQQKRNLPFRPGRSRQNETVDCHREAVLNRFREDGRVGNPGGGRCKTSESSKRIFLHPNLLVRAGLRAGQEVAVIKTRTDCYERCVSLC